MFRRSESGLCANCAITCFVKTGPLAQVTGGAWSAPGFEIGSALRLPHIQKQFEAVFAASGSPDFGGQVNWEKVIANWELLLPKDWDWKGEIRIYGRRK